MDSTFEFFNNKKHGRLEVVVGCMFSGKSEELIRRIKRAKIAKQKVQVFKPIIDNRYHSEKVVSHNGVEFTALAVDDWQDIKNLVEEDTKVVGIDEVQFFDDGIIETCLYLVEHGKRVIVAGLDRDFRGWPFGPVPNLLALAEIVDKLHAICVQCGGLASMTQLIVDKEVSKNSILIGGSENYEARCRSCHTVTLKGVV